jgi:hypothetical protein
LLGAHLKITHPGQKGYDILSQTSSRRVIQYSTAAFGDRVSFSGGAGKALSEARLIARLETVDQTRADPGSCDSETQV